jgi:hypothetical protein
MTDGDNGDELEYCQAFACPIETTPLAEDNSIWVHPRDITPDETGFVSSNPIVDQRWHIHTTCFDAALHAPV